MRIYDATLPSSICLDVPTKLFFSGGDQAENRLHVQKAILAELARGLLR
jgi:hypothetical protein